ncbi:MAG: DUF4197 domain-containing protein [Gammaproteobacteria bacterium]
MAFIDDFKSGVSRSCNFVELGARLALMTLLAVSLSTLTIACAQRDLDEIIRLGTGSGAASAVLSNDEIVAGLKEALAQGAEQSINALGRHDGFLGDASVRIPVPEKLRPVESALRTVGQSRYADEFITTMNRAAERAVPEASAILGDAIRQITLPEARNILNGPDDAATQYFREVGENRLVANMLPIVKEATSRTGVTASYKSLVDRAGPLAALANMDATDIDRYVTGKALDGLFLLIAAEEKRIRENPLARSTELLKKVFGSVSR